MGLSEPSAWMASAAMSCVPCSVTYTAVVVLSTATADGPEPPVAKGEPFTAPRAPVLGSIRYTETLLEPALAANSSAPWGSAATPGGGKPRANTAPVDTGRR